MQTLALPPQLQRVANFFGGLGEPPPPKTERPLRIGVIGASTVATYALLWPARRLPDVAVTAVATRDSAPRAREYARRHGIPAAYGSYAELVADPTLDAIYVATPNGVHGEWTAAALRAGRHVLCEKPFAANAAEAREVQRLAARRGLLCREAFHYKEHPASQAVARLVAGGAVGRLASARASVLIPSWAFGDDDIRFNASLAGGTMMDGGCYAAHALRFLTGGAAPRRVVRAAPGSLCGGGGGGDDDIVDESMRAEVAYAGGATGTLHADLRARWPTLLPTSRFEATGDAGSLTFENFITPFFGHTITLTTRTPQAAAAAARAGVELAPVRGGGNKKGGAEKEEQQPPRRRRWWWQQQRRAASSSASAAAAVQSATFEVYGSGESNYYYQLQRFASDVRALQGQGQGGAAAARDARASMRADAADAVGNMALVDAIYAAAGLPLRLPTAEFYRRARRRAGE